MLTPCTLKAGPHRPPPCRQTAPLAHGVPSAGVCSPLYGARRLCATGYAGVCAAHPAPYRHPGAPGRFRRHPLCSGWRAAPLERALSPPYARKCVRDAPGTRARTCWCRSPAPAPICRLRPTFTAFCAVPAASADFPPDGAPCCGLPPRPGRRGGSAAAAVSCASIAARGTRLIHPGGRSHSGLMARRAPRGTKGDWHGGEGPLWRRPMHAPPLP